MNTQQHAGESVAAMITESCRVSWLRTSEQIASAVLRGCHVERIYKDITPSRLSRIEVLRAEGVIRNSWGSIQ